MSKAKLFETICRGREIIQAMMTKIKPMGEEDIPVVAEIENEAFSEPWSEITLKSELARGDKGYARVALRGHIVGYSFSAIGVDELEVLRIAVLQEHRGKRIGSDLLRDIIHFCSRSGIKKQWIEVRESNLIAIGAYKKHDFRIITERPGYYPSSNEGALIMLRDQKHD